MKGAEEKFISNFAHSKNCEFYDKLFSFKYFCGSLLGDGLEFTSDSGVPGFLKWGRGRGKVPNKGGEQLQEITKNSKSKFFSQAVPQSPLPLPRHQHPWLRP